MARHGGRCCPARSGRGCLESRFARFLRLSGPLTGKRLGWSATYTVGKRLGVAPRHRSPPPTVIGRFWDQVLAGRYRPGRRNPCGRRRPPWPSSPPPPYSRPDLHVADLWAGGDGGFPRRHAGGTSQLCAVWAATLSVVARAATVIPSSTYRRRSDVASGRGDRRGTGPRSMSRRKVFVTCFTEGPCYVSTVALIPLSASESSGRHN